MKLLDIFSGAGGAAMGYHRAGFDVVGIDIKPQPHYPFPFIPGDALDILARMIAGERFLATDDNRYGLDDFAAIHASPPCQKFSKTYALPGVGEYPDLITPVRPLLIKSGKPYAIENLHDAPLINPVMLCGSMFGLKLIRHRNFECNPEIVFSPATCQCSAMFTNSSRAYSSFKNGATAITVAGNNYPLVDGLQAMGIDWMTTRDELSEAIPPAYTEYIGKFLKEAIE